MVKYDLMHLYCTWNWKHNRAISHSDALSLPWRIVHEWSWRPHVGLLLATGISARLPHQTYSCLRPSLSIANCHPLCVVLYCFDHYPLHTEISMLRMRSILITSQTRCPVKRRYSINHPVVAFLWKITASLCQRVLYIFPHYAKVNCR